MPASFASMQLESDSQTLENPPRFNPLENRSNWQNECGTVSPLLDIPSQGSSKQNRLRKSNLPTLSLVVISSPTGDKCRR